MKNRVSKVNKQFFIFIILFSANSFSFASDFSKQNNKIGQSQKLYLPDIPEAEFLPQDFVKKVQPKKIEQDTSGQAVLNQMADDVLAYWWELSPMRNTAFVRAAEQIEKKVQLNAEITDINKQNHRFNFKILALQALARLEYKGWFDFGITYNAKAAQTEVQFLQPIGSGKDVAISQRVDSGQASTKVAFIYEW